MPTMRRVVTGHAANGKSIIASDQTITGIGIPGMPGFELLQLWGADQTLEFPDAGTCPPYETFFPPIGGFRLLAFSIPPDADVAAADAAHDHAAMDAALPGLGETMDDEVPGMHRSASVDLLYVIAGACELELDDGSRTALRAGDVAIQSGTMHAWRNSHREPCRVLAITIGARQK